MRPAASTPPALPSTITIAASPIIQTAPEPDPGCSTLMAGGAEMAGAAAFCPDGVPLDVACLRL
jgi:hypothetical protein